MRVNGVKIVRLENLQPPETLGHMVELRGFEPLAPSMRTRCATGLRHSPQPAAKITSRIKRS
jgi:hypothetical protein